MATVLTSVGEEFVVDKLNETVQTKPEYLGWGTGVGTAAKGDVDLFIPASEARVQCTLSKVGSGSAATLQIVGTLTANGTKTITNFGIFDVVSGGGSKLIIHADHAGVPVDVGDQIQYTVVMDPQ